MRDRDVQPEGRTPVRLPDVVQEVKHLVPAGEVVGVSCRRHPRKEHGDDHHEEWESPIGHRLTTRLPTGSSSLTRCETSSRHFDGCHGVANPYRVSLQRNSSGAQVPAAHAQPGPQPVVAGRGVFSTVFLVVTANTDSDRTVFA